MEHLVGGGTKADAEAALAESLEAIGLGLRPAALEADVAVDLGDGRVLQLEVKTLSHASPGRIADLLRKHPALDARPGFTFVLVADTIPVAARALLNEAEWGWLDRRGHLRLSGPGLHLDTDVPSVSSGSLRATGPPKQAIVGRAGRAAALHLLMAPDRRLAVRSTASAAGLSPSSISRAVGRLRAASLADDDGRPLVPELFWELAEVWPHDVTLLKRQPSPTTGWALTGTRAALAWGAPLVASEDQPPEVYVPSSAVERRAAQRNGVVTKRAAAAAAIRVAPVAAVVTTASSRPGEQWPVAHPVVVALDLAADKARGVEILSGWDPPAPYTRVW